jgi:hypothetical protein
VNVRHEQGAAFSSSLPIGMTFYVEVKILEESIYGEPLSQGANFLKKI